MRTELYWIETVGPGRLAVMPRPRGGDWLEGEILGLKDDGVDIIVSMLTPEEEVYLELEREGATARRQGLTFYSHPVWDRGIPEDPAPTCPAAPAMFRKGRNSSIGIGNNVVELFSAAISVTVCR